MIRFKKYNSILQESKTSIINQEGVDIDVWINPNNTTAQIILKKSVYEEVRISYDYTNVYAWDAALEIHSNMERLLSDQLNKPTLNLGDGFLIFNEALDGPLIQDEWENALQYNGNKITILYDGKYEHRIRNNSKINRLLGIK